MAEVLSEHQFMHHIFNGVTQKRYLACSCGEMPLAGDHPTHLADALTAAGFGNLHDAWAEGAVAAIEREHTYGAEEKAKFDNPYPKP
jgi:hypothetical protein